MKLQNISVKECVDSETNVKGRSEGKSFDELTASIKEKGVLQPILVRKTGDFYEVIAGNRRLSAAVKAGLETIPAQIVEMNDLEAREAQIIENLQRADIHPLDEGEQYRQLIEEGKYEIASVAAKVAKNESYVKQRLFLTNLVEKAAGAYRTGKILDGHAVLIAKLSTGDQEKVLKEVNSRYNQMTVKDLKEWIEENIYSQLDNQPWLKSKELMEAVGKCNDACGIISTVQSLFGQVKEGACTSLKCWKQKMDRYVDHLAKTEKRTKVSSEYGQAPKGIKGRGEYTVVAKKGKDRCESAHGAVVAVGAEIGQTFDICSNPKCEVHHGQSGEYRRSPEEEAKAKAERKAEKEKAVKAKEDREKKLAEALKKIKWPMSKKHLEALLALSMDQASSLIWSKVAKRHELEVKKTKTEWGSTNFNYEGAVKKFAEGLDETGKARLAFELLIDTGYDTLRAGIGKI